MIWEVLNDLSWQVNKKLTCGVYTPQVTNNLNVQKWCKIEQQR